MEAAAPSPTRDDLSALVREANDAGDSFQRLSDRTRDPETGEPLVSKPYLQKLARNRVTTPPTSDRLEVLATALRQPLPVVQRAAAAQFLNFTTTELAGYDEDVRVIVAHLTGMEKGDLRRWRAMVEADERARSQVDK